MSIHETKVTFKTIRNDINNSDSAIREAVANAIDAKSKNIYLYVYKETDKGSLGSMFEYFCLDIADDGDGIPIKQEDFEEVFCQYKVSTKKEKTNYGRKGKGRYTYLTLSKSPDNVAIYTTKSNKLYRIYFVCKENENIKIYNEEFTTQIDTKIKQKYNTLIQFKDLSRDKFNIEEEIIESYIDDTKNEIISFFADRIASKSIKIYINDELLKIDDYLEKPIIIKEVKIDEDNLELDFQIDYYIWNDKIKLKSDRQKHILFFDENNSLKGIAPSGKNKLAFASFKQNHSIIVKSKYFNEMNFIDDSDDYTNILTDKIIKRLRKEITLALEYILLDIYKENIDKVSDEYIKFLKLSQDEITKKAYHAIMLPFIDKFGNKNIADDIKSIIANLIDTLIKEAPDSYITNIDNILKLSSKDSEKIRYVEENYGIIKAISEKEKYIKRIDFLNTFDNLVNGKSRAKVKERTMLHHVVDKNLWLIDEVFEDVKYSQIASDIALKTILEDERFYQFNSDELEKIISENDIKKVPDIFIPIEKNNIIYVIELKKPKVKISQKIIGEVMDKYVRTLREINNKYSLENKKKIHAIAISDAKNGTVFSMGNLDAEGIYIEPKTWSEVIQKTRERYNLKIIDLDNKLKNSKWKNLEDFVLSHQNQKR